MYVINNIIYITHNTINIVLNFFYFFLSYLIDTIKNIISNYFVRLIPT